MGWKGALFINILYNIPTFFVHKFMEYTAIWNKKKYYYIQFYKRFSLNSKYYKIIAYFAMGCKHLLKETSKQSTVPKNQ